MSNRPLKVLYYNWVDYLDADKRGGGVSVYQKAVVESLAGDDKVQISFIASGTEFSLFRKQPHVKEIKPYLGSRRFELMNSQVPAPGHLAFDNPACIHAQETTRVFAEFIKSQGGFDVIHFNNLEGLPAEVLALRDEFKETKFIFSLHNYYAVCPQVNLWWREKDNCTDSKGGRNCIACLDYEPSSNWVRKANLLSRTLHRFGLAKNSRPHRLIFHLIDDSYRTIKNVLKSSKPVELKVVKPSENSPLQYQQRRRQDFTHYVNTYCDCVLAVSGRVAEVAAKFGIDPALIRISYIGTKVAESYIPPDMSLLREQVENKSSIVLGYLGYMRRDKGFYFLMDALESMPEELTRKISVVIAARMSDPSIPHRLALIADSFHSVEFSDGYTHDMLDDLYGKIDLAVVPVLWEDNLPQVAIESVCHHTPVLSSDLGGAKEMGGSNAGFIFRAGDREQFYDRLQAFVDDPTRLLDFWNTSRVPTTMQEHANELLEIYRQSGRNRISSDESSDLIANDQALRSVS
ncbi:MAG: glycosyltransferase [Pseudomonadota bacterium]